MTNGNGIKNGDFLEKCFFFDAVETSYRIEAAVPEAVRGTYYVNGPARFERAGMRYKHWLDGDGMVISLQFSDHGTEFTSRFIHTKKLCDEQAAQRFLYRGFGTAFSGDRLRRNVMLEPPVNVSVYPFNGMVLAFGEQSLPFALDPVTLETQGEYDFHGKLNEVSPFAAHAKFDPASGNLINFGISYAYDRPVVNVFEFRPGGELIRRKRHALRMAHSNHDFGITPDHVVFHLSPLQMDFPKFWAGASVIESLTWEPEKGSVLFIAPREKKEEAFAVPAGNGYCLHQINCFEDGQHLVVDILELESPVYFDYQPMPDLFAEVSPCRPVRFVVDLASRTLLERRVLDYSCSPDFPSINPKLAGSGYDEWWMLGISTAGQPGRKFFDQLAHGSWSRGAVDDVYQTEPGVYLGGEPVLANGYVVVECLDSREEKAEFQLFDAGHVAKGPVARLPLKHMIHPGFHASFASA
jgi:all-trans-8'-apo-beta-carotenal 15,15'-oxygenase